MALKPYKKTHDAIAKKYQPKPTIPSGVACSEVKCDGEMMLLDPIKKHPELKELGRAMCGTCGWRGWVPAD